MTSVHTKPKLVIITFTFCDWWEKSDTGFLYSPSKLSVCLSCEALGQGFCLPGVLPFHLVGFVEYGCAERMMVCMHGRDDDKLCAW